MVEYRNMARPLEYNNDYVEKAKEYLLNCTDEVEIFTKTEGNTSTSFERIVKVKIPTIDGLADYLDISRETVYDWESKYSEFSDITGKLRRQQADRLINGGLSGTYNSTIAKVLLTKHGYTDKIEQEISGKDGGAIEVNVGTREIIKKALSDL